MFHDIVSFVWTKKSLYVKCFTSNLKNKVPFYCFAFLLQAVFLPGPVSATPSFPPSFSVARLRSCPHFHNSHQMTLSSYLEATRQTLSAFPRCWKGTGRHWSRGSVKSSVFFGRQPHTKSSKLVATGLSEWWKGNHCCPPDKLSLFDDEASKQAWISTT